MGAAGSMAAEAKRGRLRGPEGEKEGPVRIITFPWSAGVY